METNTCRERLAVYCKGVGVDVGFGGWAITPSAMCLDREEYHPNRAKNPDASPTHLIGEAEDLRWFRDNVLDYVYSSHCLEDFSDIKKVLVEWLRVIKPGGFLVLFLPDEKVYRSVTPENIRNKAHQHEDFSMKFVKSTLRELGYLDSDIVHELWPVPNNQYSFDLVVKKQGVVVDSSGTIWLGKPAAPVQRKLNTASYENRKILQMGHYGDIINILPIARDISNKTGKPVSIICNKHCADILEGVSYAVAEIPDADCKLEDLAGYGVLNTHVACPTSPRRLPYNLQAWEQVGYLDRFHNLFPVFDRRCRVREIALVESLVTFEKPVMLVELSGLSSPMAEHARDEIRKLIHESFDAYFQIIDIGKAQRPYDLLGLIDVASIILTVDTMLLHLATATTVPVVAFLSNHLPVFWRATATKGNVVFSATYDKVALNWEQVVKAVETHKRCLVLPDCPVYHVVPIMLGEDKDTSRRLTAASKSWVNFHNQGATFVPYTEDVFVRSFTLGGHKLPYLKDAFKHALERATGNDDIICFTNADIILTGGFYAALQHRMVYQDYCCAFRMEFEAETPLCGHRDCGRDVFAFKRRWLAEHFDEVPDFLIGVGGWDYALAMWFRVLSGRAPESCNPAVIMPDIEMDYGFNWHERHEAPWYKNVGTTYAAAAAHNRACLEELFGRLGLGQAHKDVI